MDNTTGNKHVFEMQEDEERSQPMLPSATPRGRRLPQYLAAVAATMGAMAAGSVLAWTSPMLPLLQSPGSSFVVTKEEGSWVGSLVAVGALGGAFPAGYAAQTFGRKIVILSLSVPFVVSWLIIVTAQNVAMLYVARLIAGVATGAISVTVPMYISEIAQADIRGALGSFFQLMLTVGILFVYVIGSSASYTTLAIVCGFIPILFAITFMWMPETPIHLMRKNRMKDAERSFKFLRGKNYDTESEMYTVKSEVHKSQHHEASVKDLFSSRSTVNALVVSLGLMIFQQLSGINVVIFYTVQIFASAGSTLSASVSTIIVGVVQVVTTYVATILVDRAGRRLLLLFSSSIMAVSLAALGLYFYLRESGTDVSYINFLPAVSVTVFVIVFSLGFGPLPWMMISELFPADVKGVAVGIAVTLNWLLVFSVTKSFENLLNVLGMHCTYWLFAAVCVVATIFVQFLVPETKGKTLQAIEKELNGSLIVKKRTSAL